MTNLVSLLLECAERLEEGLESEGGMEAEWSKADRELIARIRSAVEPSSEPEVEQLRGDNAMLRRALTSCRAQWIHSVNARRCLEALGELPAERTAEPTAPHEPWCEMINTPVCTCGAAERTAEPTDNLTAWIIEMFAADEIAGCGFYNNSRWLKAYEAIKTAVVTKKTIEKPPYCDKHKIWPCPNCHTYQHKTSCASLITLDGISACLPCSCKN